MLTDLQGQIERITYTNEETGYTIAKVKVYGRRDLVTVVGNFWPPGSGDRGRELHGPNAWRNFKNAGRMG